MPHKKDIKTQKRGTNNGHRKYVALQTQPTNPKKSQKTHKKEPKQAKKQSQKTIYWNLRSIQTPLPR